MQNTAASTNYSPSQSISKQERVFGFRDHASLWFSLGVGLLVMQMGAYLIPALGTRSALFAIIIGSVLGSALLAWVAQLGCNYGLSSAELMQATYGRSFAKLPVILNIIQLLGWTAFELVVMRDGFTAIITQTTGFNATWLPFAITAVFGALLFALASSPMIKLVRRIVVKFGLPLVIFSLLWLSVQFTLRVIHSEGGFSAFWHKTGTGEMSILAAIDLVIAMPVSWLPLVADYSRYGKLDGQKSAFKGTWTGYVIANIWCYGLGVLIISTTTPDVDLVSAILLAQFGLIALGLILIDEMDNAYGDVHSGAVSLNYLLNKTSIITWGKYITVAAAVAAMILDMHGLEPFLLMLSSIFVPLYGVIIARLSFKSTLDEGVNDNASPVHIPSATIWLVGIAVFHLCAHYAPQFGSAIPSLVVSLGLGWLVRK